MTLPKLHEIVWKLRDEAMLRRKLALACANLSHSEATADALFGHFWKQIQSHPLEWPSSSRSPSEHTWRFGRVILRYRVIPDAQTIEIISVSGPDA